MPTSAGLLPFRRTNSAVEVLIAHPGGPFFARKHEGAWSVVKGLIEDGEDAIDAAHREFTEETGFELPPFKPIELGEVRLKGGKIVIAWALEADFDLDAFEPGTFQMEWRGATRTFPEIDRVIWTSGDEARLLLNPAQAPFVDRLLEALAMR
jgi:predicted NUDIX family NTP pyrophosphohydrolase